MEARNRLAHIWSFGGRKKSTKTNQIRGKVLSTNNAVITGCPYGDKMNLAPSYLLYTEVNFKLIVDLNIKTKIKVFRGKHKRISL